MLVVAEAIATQPVNCYGQSAPVLRWNGEGRLMFNETGCLPKLGDFEQRYLIASARSVGRASLDQLGP